MVDLNNIANFLYNYSAITAPSRAIKNISKYGIGEGVYRTLFPKMDYTLPSNKQQPVAQTSVPSQPSRRNYGFKPDTIQGQIISEAYNRGVDPALALAIARQESGFNPNAYGDRNVGGSYGLFQIHQPSHPGYKGKFDPTQNIQYGVGLLANLNKRFGGDLNKVIQAYNAGAGAVSSGKIPNSTRNIYLPNVLKYYNEYNKGNTQPTKTQTLNQRQPAASTTGVNMDSNMNLPNINFIPLNGQSGASGQIDLNSLVNLMDLNNNNYRPTQQDLLGRINAISSLVSGAQQGNVYQDISATPEEVEAYKKAYEQMGRNLAGQINQANSQVNNLANLLQQGQNIQNREALINAGANVLQNLIPPQQHAIARDFTGAVVGETGTTQRPVNNVEPRSLEEILTPALKLEEARANIAQDVMEQQNNLAERQAQLNSAIRMSQALGIPLGTAMNLSGKDYVDLVTSQLEGRTDLAKEGLGAITDLISGDYKARNDLANTSLQNQGDIVNTLLSGQLTAANRQAMEQGLNQRANLAAQVDLYRTLLNNATQRDVANQYGINALQLEGLKQQDPNAYARVMASLLETGALLGNPITPQLYETFMGDMAQQYGLNIPNTTSSNNGILDYYKLLKRK